MPTPEGIITTSTIWTQGEPDAVDNISTDETQEEQVQEDNRKDSNANA